MLGTITISVISHITVFADGSGKISYSPTTLTKAVVAGNGDMYKRIKNHLDRGRIVIFTYSTTYESWESSNILLLVKVGRYVFARESDLYRFWHHRCNVVHILCKREYDHRPTFRAPNIPWSNPYSIFADPRPYYCLWPFWTRRNGIADIDPAPCHPRNPTVWRPRRWIMNMPTPTPFDIHNSTQIISTPHVTRQVRHICLHRNRLLHPSVRDVRLLICLQQ